GIDGLPGPCRIEGAAAVTDHIDHSAQNRNCCVAAVIGRGWRVEGPGRTLLHCLIRAAACNDWRGGVHHGHLLAARAVVAAAVGSLPGPRRIEGAAAMTRRVGHSADDRNGGGTASINRNRRIEGPWRALFD